MDGLKHWSLGNGVVLALQFLRIHLLLLTDQKSEFRGDLRLSLFGNNNAIDGRGASVENEGELRDGIVCIPMVFTADSGTFLRVLTERHEVASVDGHGHGVSPLTWGDDVRTMSSLRADE